MIYNFARRVAVLCAMAAVMFASHAAAEDGESEKYVFRYKFSPGDVLQWEVVSKIDQMTSKSGQKDNTETRCVSTKNWTVLEVDASGTAVLEYSIRDVDMQCSSSLEKAELKYNSRTDEKPPVQYLDVAELIGKPIAHFTINSQGEIMERSQKAKVAATMQFLETAEENRITIPMPEYAVGVGDGWDYPREIMIPQPNGTVKKVAVRERYTLEKVQNGIATFEFKTYVMTPLYDDKDTEWALRTKIRNGRIQFDMVEGRSISQQYDMKRTAIDVQRIRNGSATYQSRFTEKYLRDGREPAANETAGTSNTISR